MDVLVDFEVGPTFDSFMGLKLYRMGSAIVLRSSKFHDLQRTKKASKPRADERRSRHRVGR